ncbi:MAG: hypothetical protein RBS68_08480 [Anaerolineales bacterium]|jgi:hypothetical protein|nr:hypothetical protein [Anaerolineales bacterium]
MPFLSLLPIFGFVCFIIAAVFIFVRPTPGPEMGFLNGYILHWFHPLAWALFGIAAFYQKSSSLLALALLGFGVIVYAFFIKAFLTRTK